MTAAARPRRRTLGRRLRDALMEHGGPPLMAGAIRLIRRLRRFEYVDLHNYRDALASGRPTIFAFWHEDMIGIAMAHLRFHHPPPAIMISRSRDGELLARVVERLNLKPVRASSTRGAVRGFIEMHDWLVRESPRPALGAVALDGPRGPRHVAKPGVIMLARKANAIVVPVAFAHTRELVFKSWDRTRLPLPLGRTRVFLGEPFDLDAHTDDEPAAADALQRHLMRVCERARPGATAADAPDVQS